MVVQTRTWSDAESSAVAEDRIPRMGMAGAGVGRRTDRTRRSLMRSCHLQCLAVAAAVEWADIPTHTAMAVGEVAVAVQSVVMIWRTNHLRRCPVFHRSRSVAALVCTVVGSMVPAVGDTDMAHKACNPVEVVDTCIGVADSRTALDAGVEVVSVEAVPAVPAVAAGEGGSEQLQAAAISLEMARR